MNRLAILRILALTVLLTPVACSTLDKLNPVREEPAIKNQRASIAMASLKGLTEINAYIRLDNRSLLDHLENSLQAQAASTGIYSFSKLRVRFGQQVITIDATLGISQSGEKTLSAKLTGDVILTFSGNQLVWLPHFEHLTVLDKDFEFEKVAYPVSTAELETELLGRTNRDITDVLIVQGKNAIQMNPLPLGEIEVGASLRNFDNLTAASTRALGGVFTVAGSSILIQPEVTSIALDLEFIPNISNCPVDIKVSRSTFASNIVNREPVGISRLLGEGKVLSHFYTEISGATRSTSVLHYWFADGKPVALEELPVEPSFRWRTWSSVQVDQSQARNWEVIVVEKTTGCILHSLAIQAQPLVDSSADTTVSAPETFETFSREFERRVSEFSILQEKPDIALIQVPQVFLARVLHDSLKDTKITVDFDLDNLPAQKLQGNLVPFSVDDILCEERNCTNRRSCETGYSQCTRKRDTRTCTTCLFRNPLNNRCVNEVSDPICEAAKSNQNNTYEAALESCQERESVERMECEKLSALEQQSCEIEAAAEQNICESAREVVRARRNATTIAGIYMTIRTSGSLKAVFSDFSLENDLNTIRLKLGFKANMRLSGSVRFDPRDSLGTLGLCINSWQKTFHGKLLVPQQEYGLIGAIVTSFTDMSASWSGLELTAPIHPSPLEAMFVDNPNLLADCGIGLTVHKVRKAVEGDVQQSLAGNFKFEIQPETSHIRLANASVQIGERLFEARPELSATYLKYDIRD